MSLFQQLIFSLYVNVIDDVMMKDHYWYNKEINQGFKVMATSKLLFLTAYVFNPCSQFLCPPLLSDHCISRPIIIGVSLDFYIFLTQIQACEPPSLQLPPVN